MIYRGLCTDLLAFTLQLRKLQLGDNRLKAVRPVVASNGGPLPPDVVGKTAQHVRNGKGGTEGKDMVTFVKEKKKNICNGFGRL